MRTLRVLGVGAVLFGVLMLQPAWGQTAKPGEPTSAKSRGALIGQVLAEIQNGLGSAQASLRAAKMPELDSVTLTLLTQYKKTEQGLFKLFVVFGGSSEEEATNQLVLTLKPPASGRESAKPGPGLSELLVGAIKDAAEGVKNAGTAGVPLEADSLTAEFQFAVIESHKIGIEFEIVPAGGEIGGGWSKKAVHTVAVKFAKKAAAAKY